MMKAYLNGTKTQTRRIMDPQPVPNSLGYSKEINDILCRIDSYPPSALLWKGGWLFGDEPGKYQQGEKLWFRETWKPTGLFSFYKIQDTKACRRFAYAADDHQEPRDKHIPWRPSIHMPRWAARATPEILAVRAQRIQSITDEDAKAEGVKPVLYCKGEGTEPHSMGAYRASFMRLWRSIYGELSWGENPWVWAITFLQSV